MRAHFEPCPAPFATTLDAVKLPALPLRPLALLPLLAGLALPGHALAQAGGADAAVTAAAVAVGLLPAHLAQAEAVAQAAAVAAAPPGARIDVQLGAPDPRLRLAPCPQVEALLPAGQPALGRTRVGLRCASGGKPWNITLPVTVSALAPAVVLRGALPAGTALAASHLQLAEVDWGAGPAFASGAALIGRELQRPMAAGQALRAADLKTRQWFSAGETVKLVARGAGFSVTTEAQALSHGLEGQPVRVRTASGRVLNGRATGDREVEVLL